MKNIAIPLLAFLTAGCAQNVSTFDLAAPHDRAYYAMGYATGEALKKGLDERQIDYDIFLSAMKDSVTGSDALLTEVEMAEAEAQYRLYIEEVRARDFEESISRNKAEGELFQTTFSSDKDVVVTESGLMYRVLNSGDGSARPTPDDTVVVHYHGTLTSGEAFDSSVERGAPLTFKLNRVIEGWQEAIQLMSPGDKWQIVVPPHLAYGEQGSGNMIGPNLTLVFDIELLEINPEA